METQRNYTGHAWQGSDYKPSMTAAEIAKEIRERLKKEFPGLTFSVTKKSYSGGRSITVALMEAPFHPLVSGANNEDVNHYHLKDSKRITEEGKVLLSRVIEIVQSLNYDDSDGMIDYFDTNFYFHLHVGKWNKPFQIRS